jgi:uncharacterized membrane protein YccF (DUF307 family)
MTAPRALDLLIAAAAALQALTAVGVPAALAVLTLALIARPASRMLIDAELEELEAAEDRPSA